ncbi:hypothetical protein NIES4074_61430 (plasmid) [Cylindrospermum sp. NIES-4074]|nr:hypothetical protein NIES4074_61430 [Cylindrospermum sp. NIES-4074]
MTTNSDDFAYPIYANSGRQGGGAVFQSRGLTKRELFALEILTGLVVQSDNDDLNISRAVNLAQKLIEKLNETEEQSPDMWTEYADQ